MTIHALYAVALCDGAGKPLASRPVIGDDAPNVLQRAAQYAQTYARMRGHAVYCVPIRCRGKELPRAPLIALHIAQPGG